MNKVVLEINEDEFNNLAKQGLIAPNSLKEVKIDDSFLENDIVYQDLKTKSIKAYKELVTYRFNKLHNIKK